VIGLRLRKGGSEKPERWFSLTGTVAQIAPDYPVRASRVAANSWY